ncbi:MAG: ABC transporter ATP-binding protein [Acidimicrobiales bacterium]
MKAANASQTGSVAVAALSHRFPGTDDDVLRDVSLEVASGQSLALLGPSGCGKTTLLRTLAGLERPTSGTVTLDGNVVTGPRVFVPPERRRIGMVFQDWALFPHLTVGRNVSYGVARRERAERVAASLKLVGLEGLEDRLPSTLSGGQQQRVALARALAPRPHVLLLDEPFSNLDTNLRAEVRAEVRQLLIDVGITSIFVTHDQDEAFVVGDKIAVMREGRIEQTGNPYELYERPATRWVADFVGEASIVAGVASGAMVTTPLGELPLEEPKQGAVDIVLRPEQLAITEGDTATVELIEFYWHDAMVVVSFDGQQIRVRTGPNPGLTRGSTVDVVFTGSAVHAFSTA